MPAVSGRGRARSATILLRRAPPVAAPARRGAGVRTVGHKLRQVHGFAPNSAPAVSYLPDRG